MGKSLQRLGAPGHGEVLCERQPTERRISDLACVGKLKKIFRGMGIYLYWQAPSWRDSFIQASWALHEGADRIGPALHGRACRRIHTQSGRHRAVQSWR